MYAKGNEGVPQSIPPPYAVANAPPYTVANDAAYFPPQVMFQQPMGYNEPYQSNPHAVVPSVPVGRLRLDKAKRIGDRLIIDFEKVSCCPWELTGLDPDCRNFIPEELRLKGISQDQWSEWCDELMKVQKKDPSVTGCLCIFCFPGGIVQSILCATFCPTSADHCLKWVPCFYGDWYVGLAKWQRNVNEVLNRKDMHAKLKTYKPFTSAPKSLTYGTRIAGKDHNYEMSMLEIALTAAESQRLMEESWDNGVNDGCTSGIGRVL